MRPQRSGSTISSVGLVVANIAPLVGVVALGWDLYVFLVVYWLENGLVGVVSVAKFRRAADPQGPALPSVAFFVGHYGLFWVGHGVAVLVLGGLLPAFTIPSARAVAVPTVGLAASHAVSYGVDYVGGGEYEHIGSKELMFGPYKRVIVLHLTVVLGFFIIEMLGAPHSALVLLILLKTVIDLRGHWKERERAREQPSSQAAPA